LTHCIPVFANTTDRDGRFFAKECIDSSHTNTILTNLNKQAHSTLRSNAGLRKGPVFEIHNPVFYLSTVRWLFDRKWHLLRLLLQIRFTGEAWCPF